MDWSGTERNGQDRIGPEWTGTDWTGPDWTGMEWTGVDRIGAEWNRFMIYPRLASSRWTFSHTFRYFLTMARTVLPLSS